MDRADMTHPLTPREKVKLKPSFGDVIENGWASDANPTRIGFFVREFTRTGRLNPGVTWEITDGKGKFWEFKPKDISEGGRLKVTSRTALASGSGDHAELARLAEAMRSGKFSQGDRIRVATLSEALIAEIAALRGENEHVKKLRHQAIDRSRLWEIDAIKWETRATEAERKLAEAVGLLTRWLNTRGEMSGAGTVETATSTFLSKEAERG